MIKLLETDRFNNKPKKAIKRSNSSENILQIREDEQTGAVGPPTQRPVKIEGARGRPKKLIFSSIRRDAASQICYNQNALNEDDTQSEDSFGGMLDKEINGNRRKRDDVERITENAFQFTMFADYLQWFEQNHVAVTERYEKMISEMEADGD